uniref:Small ribosomal subunit protein uS15m n=1 Tax=Xenopus tropicalis TaxID=8364 RepID=A0A803K8X7_XENTR
MLCLRRIVCDLWGRGITANLGPMCVGSRSVACQRAVTENGAPDSQIPSQLDDLPPTMLKTEYTGVQLSDAVDDVVKRLLSLEMASQAEKLKIKTQQLVDKVKRDPHDTRSPEVRIAALTAKIRNYREHIQKHPKDKSNKRKMLMAIDKRKKMLKNLRLTRYDAFEHVCAQLGIEYTFPPEYYRRATRRWLAKKALCLKVYNEAKRLQAAGLLKKRRPSRVQSKETQGKPV